MVIYVQKRGVSHYSLAIYIEKYLKAKEELWKFKNIIFKKKILLKKPKSFKKSQLYN